VIFDTALPFAVPFAGPFRWIARAEVLHDENARHLAMLLVAEMRKIDKEVRAMGKRERCQPFLCLTFLSRKRRPLRWRWQRALPVITGSRVLLRTSTALRPEYSVQIRHERPGTDS
jgi:hypothetical protein